MPGSRSPNPFPTAVGDTIAWVADVSRAHANQKGMHLEVAVLEDRTANADPSQLQQALTHLVLNEADVFPAGGTVFLRGHEQDLDSPSRATSPAPRNGDLALTCNRPNRICFSLGLPSSDEKPHLLEISKG